MATNQTDPLDDYWREVLDEFNTEVNDSPISNVPLIYDHAVAAINAEIAKARPDFSKVNRVEVIDHTKSLEDGGGRTVVAWKKQPLDVKVGLQDDGRTLKLFVGKPHEI